MRDAAIATFYVKLWEMESMGLWPLFEQSMIAFNNLTLRVALSKSFLRLMAAVPIMTVTWIFLRYNLTSADQCMLGTVPACPRSVSAVLATTEGDSTTIVFNVSTYLFTLVQLVARFWTWTSDPARRKGVLLVLFSIRFAEALSLIGVLAYELNLYRRDLPDTQHLLFAAVFFFSTFFGTFWEYHARTSKHAYLYELMVGLGVALSLTALTGVVDSSSIFFGTAELLLLWIYGAKVMLELSNVRIVETLIDGKI